MRYKEERRNLFRVDKDYMLVHCISSDFKMGAGIAVAFTNMGVKAELMERYPRENFDAGTRWRGHGYCLKTSAGNASDKHKGVYNLITKNFYYDKPTYKTIEDALLSLREQCVANHDKKIAMPFIGCGLDSLSWLSVSEIVKNVFKDTDIDILVCYK